MGALEAMDRREPSVARSPAHDALGNDVPFGAPPTELFANPQYAPPAADHPNALLGAGKAEPRRAVEREAMTDVAPEPSTDDASSPARNEVVALSDLDTEIVHFAVTTVLARGACMLHSLDRLIAILARCTFAPTWEGHSGVSTNLDTFVHPPGLTKEEAAVALESLELIIEEIADATDGTWDVTAEFVWPTFGGWASGRAMVGPMEDGEAFLDTLQQTAMRLEAALA